MPQPIPDSAARRPSILVHGGAGRGQSSQPALLKTGMAAAARRGWEVLHGGGAALDAVVAAVAVLEDDPLFNAGLGSVLTSGGVVEMDASVMEGCDLRAGGVCAISGVRHPIHVAHAVLEQSPHVLLAGEGARQFASRCGLDLCPAESLITERQRQRWLDRAVAEARNTVGAVAVDARGHVAAATSTGGVFLKMPGRVGDSAIVGAGTYADDRTGAASATGHGEAIIRVGLAKTATDLLGGGLAPQRAAARALNRLVERTAGEAGLIVVDPYGRLGFALNTSQMPLAWMARGLDEAQVRVE